MKMKMNKIFEFLKSIGYRLLPIVNKNYYFYKESDLILPQFNINIESESNNEDDIYIYGWIIEENYKNIRRDGEDRWGQHWKNKIYHNKSSAIDAVNQFRLTSSDIPDFRIKPLYSFKNSGWRNYLIGKLINEK